MATSELVKDTILTTIYSVIGKSIGFLIPFFIAAWFGITSETDALFFAYGIILFIVGIFSPVVESVIVPYLAETRAKNEDVSEFVGNVLGFSGLSLLIISLFAFLIIRPFLEIITNFDKRTLGLIYYLIAETIPLVVLNILASIISGTLNAYKKFEFPALSPAFRAIVNLFIIFILKNSLGVHAIALGYLIGELSRFLFLLYVVKKYLIFKVSFHIDNKLKEFLMTSIYQITGMVSVGLNPVVDKTMASWLGTGSVSILHYADRLYMIPVTFATSGLMVTLLSHWSDRYYISNSGSLRDDISKVLKVIILPTLVITIILIILSEDITKLAFYHGIFDKERLPELRFTWICYLLGLPSYIIGLVYVRAYLVIKWTKILMEIAFFTVITNIVFNFFFMYQLGVKGIALATTLSVSITTLIQMYILKKTL